MNLRAEMPAAAALIDAMRAEFGADGINANIRKGMAGLPGYFYASENGREVGTKAPPAPAGKEISGADMVIGPFNQPEKEKHAARR
jgi:hypothetical protein